LSGLGLGLLFRLEWIVDCCLGLFSLFGLPFWWVAGCWLVLLDWAGWWLVLLDWACCSTILVGCWLDWVAILVGLLDWVAILVGCWLLVGAVGLGLLFNNSGGPVTLNQVL
jgi:hypothetical protein